MKRFGALVALSLFSILSISRYGLAYTSNLHGDKRDCERTETQTGTPPYATRKTEVRCRARLVMDIEKRDGSSPVTETITKSSPDYPVTSSSSSTNQGATNLAAKEVKQTKGNATDLKGLACTGIESGKQVRIIRAKGFSRSSPETWSSEGSGRITIPNDLTSWFSCSGAAVITTENSCDANAYTHERNELNNRINALKNAVQNKKRSEIKDAVERMTWSISVFSESGDSKFKGVRNCFQ